MSRAGRSRLVKALATPQVLVAGLLLVGALALALSVEPLAPGAPPTVELVTAEESLSQVDVRLVLVDLAGLEWQRSERIAAPASVPGRLAAVLAELRAALTAEGVWPEDLPAPTVFVETFDREVVAVIDLRPEAGTAVSVAQELALVRALTLTAEANGAGSVRFLRGGRPAPTLLGHVAVPSGL